MEYEKSVEFTGDPMLVIEIAQLIFIQSGYRVIEISEDYIFARHGRKIIQQPSSSALFGASCVLVSISNRVLKVEADIQPIETRTQSAEQMINGILSAGGVLMGLIFSLFLNASWPMAFGVMTTAIIFIPQKPVYSFILPKLMRKKAIWSLDKLVLNLSMRA